MIKTEMLPTFTMQMLIPMVAAEVKMVAATMKAAVEVTATVRVAIMAIVPATQLQVIFPMMFRL
jgi:hypothetical protein